MKIAVTCLTLVFSLIWFGIAHASPFDGWTLEQIKADPGFVSTEDPRGPTLSCATESGDPGAPYCHDWIGYIDLDGDWRIYFDQRGYGLTCGFQEDEYSSGWLEDMAPLWTRGLVDRLIDEEILEGYPGC